MYLWLMEIGDKASAVKVVPRLFQREAVAGVRYGPRILYTHWTYGNVCSQTDSWEKVGRGGRPDTAGKVKAASLGLSR